MFRIRNSYYSTIRSERKRNYFVKRKLFGIDSEQEWHLNWIQQKIQCKKKREPISREREIRELGYLCHCDGIIMALN